MRSSQGSGQYTQTFGRGEEAPQWAGRCREALQYFRKRSGGTLGRLLQVGRPSCRTVRGRQAHPEVWEGYGSLPGGQGGFGRPNQKSGRGGEANTESERPTRRSWWGRAAYPEVWEGSGGPAGGPGGVDRSSQWAGWCCEALSNGREGLGVHRGGPGGVGRPIQRNGRGLESHPEVRKAYMEVREGSRRPP